MPNKLAVVIVTFNAEDLIEACLDSLRMHDPEALILVVDNASTDQTCEIIREGYPAVCVLKNRCNLGFGAGNNVGIRAALQEGATHILLLNQDALVTSGALTALTRHLDEHPEAGVAAPLQVTRCQESLEPQTLRGYLQRHFTAYLAESSLGRCRTWYEGFGVNAAAWCVRSETFLKCGGFDPLFFMYGEDDDLLARWAFHRVTFHLVPSARMVHLRESPTRQSSALWREVCIRTSRRESSLLLRMKHPGRKVWTVLKQWIAFGWLLPFHDFLVQGDLAELLANWRAALLLLVKWPKIKAHQRLCERAGPHFLSILPGDPH
jgi:GT2 family glycosyltransferase